MKKIILGLFLIVFLPVTTFGAYYQIERIISVNSDGIAGNNTSRNAIFSVDGKYISFNSDATNLVADDLNNVTDVFIYNLETGETHIVSKSSEGVYGNGNSLTHFISADGRYVVFESTATNLVPGDTNGVYDIFMHDIITNTTVRVSVNSENEQSNGQSRLPKISADGRYVVFESAATNLVLDDTNGVFDVFVRDTDMGITTRVSVSSEGDQANAGLGGSGSWSAISADGRFVAFTSLATNLVLDDTNGVLDVFLRDMYANTTTRISVNSEGDESNGASPVNNAFPKISADGRYVVFSSSATNLVPNDTNGLNDVFVHDILTGETIRVSVTTYGEEIIDGSVSQVTISANAQHVGFSSTATNLVLDDTNGVFDVFVHTIETGKTTRLLLADPTQQANAVVFFPSFSGDGKYMTIHSDATNLVSDDTNGVRDIFLARKLNPELSYSGSFSEASENNGLVEGSLVVTFTNSDDTFVNPGGVLTIGVEYEIENLPVGLSSVLSVNNDGTEATLTLEGQAIDHENTHSVQNIIIRFFDDAFTIVDADDVIGSVYEEGSVEFSDRRRQSSGGSVQSQVVNLQSMGKDKEAEQVKEEFSHLFEESSTDNLLVSLLTQLTVLQNQVSLLQLPPMNQSDNYCPTLYQWIQGFSHCVQSLQSRLGNIRIDGIFGPETHNAVLSFQEKMNIRIDGIVGLETKQSLGW